MRKKMQKKIAESESNFKFPELVMVDFIWPVKT